MFSSIEWMFSEIISSPAALIYNEAIGSMASFCLACMIHEQTILVTFYLSEVITNNLLH